jgi:hypothetical protein
MTEKKKATHTPGPWRHTPTHWGGAKGGNVLCIEPCGGPAQITKICDMSMHNTFTQESGKVDILGPTEEDYANARLIATAPELLEVLESLVDVFAPPQRALSTDCLLDRARKLILKAKGEEGKKEKEEKKTTHKSNKIVAKAIAKGE